MSGPAAGSISGGAAADHRADTRPEGAILKAEWRRYRNRAVAARLALLAGLIGLGVLSVWLARVNLGALWSGLPMLGSWTMRMFPPDLAELALLAQRTLETVGMGIAGTLFAAVLAIPLTLLGTRQLAFGEIPYQFSRFIMNCSRGIDSFIFAILFVAAVGLGPFAGVLGIALHSCGSISKLWAEAIDNLDRRPALALRVMGVSKSSVWRFAIFPAACPSMLSTLLYVFEVNVRSSTVLGLVGAGGIGQELKNSVDLLLFSRLGTILILILITVTVIDRISDFCRRRLL